MYGWYLKTFSILFSRLKEFMKKREFADDDEMLSARQIASWKSKINNSFTTKSELCRNAEPSTFQFQESMLKNDKIWCRYLVTNCVSLRTFWTSLIVQGLTDEASGFALPLWYHSCNYQPACFIFCCKDWDLAFISALNCIQNETTEHL